MKGGSNADGGGAKVRETISSTVSPTLNSLIKPDNDVKPLSDDKGSKVKARRARQRESKRQYFKMLKEQHKRGQQAHKDDDESSTYSQLSENTDPEKRKESTWSTYDS